MIRERSALDAIASEIHVSGQPIALDLETYGTSEDKKIRRDETLDPWRGEIRLLSLQLVFLVCLGRNYGQDSPHLSDSQGS